LVKLIGDEKKVEDEYLETLKICCKNAKWMQITAVRTLEDEAQNLPESL